MKIKKFKFNKNMYTNKYTTIILEKTKSFGLIYLAYYIRYALEHLLKKENYHIKSVDHVIKQISKTSVSYHLQFLETKYYLEHLNYILKLLPQAVQKQNQDLYDTLYIIINQPLRKYTKKLPRIKNNLVYFEETTYERYESSYYDIKNKLAPVFKEKFDYIYIQDNSESVKNWYSYETHTRHKPTEQTKFVVPFYRYISRRVIDYHILSFLRYDLESHKYPAYWHIPNLYHYSPKEYNCEMREIGRYLRLRLQRSNIFNIETSYQNLDNKYYLYNNKLIDINYNLYELNMKWLKEGEIITKCIKKNSLAVLVKE